MKVRDKAPSDRLPHSPVHSDAVHQDEGWAVGFDFDIVNSRVAFKRPVLEVWRTRGKLWLRHVGAATTIRDRFDFMTQNISNRGRSRRSTEPMGSMGTMEPTHEQPCQYGIAATCRRTSSWRR